MKHDSIQQYVSARSALLREKAQLETRLHQIDYALGQAPSAVAVTPTPVATTSRRKRSPISMRAAVVQVTTGTPLTKPEILAAIQKLGFQSASKKPERMLDNLLYGKKPRFKRENGRFSPLSGAIGAATKPARNRRMSEAGRARLSASIKVRWAKIKKAGGRKLNAL